MRIPTDYVSLETTKMLKDAGYDDFFSKTLSQPRVLAYLYDCQKWLREVYEIDICINRSFSMNNSYYYEILLNLDFDNIIQQHSKAGISYEQALDEAIRIACEVIINDKNNYMTTLEQLKQDLYSAQCPDEVQQIIFTIADEKIRVAKTEDKPLMYAETSYLHQLEKYAERRIKDLENRRLGWLNLFHIESRRSLDKENYLQIKNKVAEIINN